MPVLTKNSLGNQWVNQEIGYAYRWKESEGIDYPYFFPVVEDGLREPAKGFLGIPVTEYIPLKRTEPEEAIYKLLLSLRKYIDRNEYTLRTLTLTCPVCKRTSETSIPPQEAIDKAIERDESLETDCQVCKRRVAIDPQTLVAEGSSSGYRWESKGFFDW